VQFFVAFDSLGSTHAAGLKGEVSGDLTEISSTKRAMCVVKGIIKANESLVDLARHCGESLVATGAVPYRD